MFKDNVSVAKYYDICELIQQSKDNIYHFYPAESIYDMEQRFIHYAIRLFLRLTETFCYK